MDFGRILVIWANRNPFQIPFSKFFLAHRGRVQDDQHELWLDKVASTLKWYKLHKKKEIKKKFDKFLVLFIYRLIPLDLLLETKQMVPSSSKSISSACAKITHTLRTSHTRSTRGTLKFESSRCAAFEQDMRTCDKTFDSFFLHLYIWNDDLSKVNKWINVSHPKDPGFKSFHPFVRSF